MSLVRERIKSQSSYLVFLLEVPERRLSAGQLELDLELTDPLVWSQTELEHPPSPARLAEADLHLEPEGPLPEPLADRPAEPGLDLLEPWVPLGWSLPELQHQPFAGRLPEAPLDLQREEVDQRLSRQTFSGWLKKKVRINYIWFLKYQLPSTQQQLNETILKRD